MEIDVLVFVLCVAAAGTAAGWATGRRHDVRAVQRTAVLPMLVLTAVVAVMVTTGSRGDADIGTGLLGIVVVFGLPAALAAAVAASHANQRP